VPVYPCRHPTCAAYVQKRGGYCEAHARQGRQERAARNRFYDQHARDPEAKKFYDSAAWQRARATKLATDPICERCQRVWAQHVHHRIPLARCTPEQRLDQRNLKSLCLPCHNIEEAEAARLESSVGDGCSS
jgi:5-methylcytosine-specific restriction protein A